MRVLVLAIGLVVVFLAVFAGQRADLVADLVPPGMG
jgi:hypothetical protein